MQIPIDLHIDLEENRMSKTLSEPTALVFFDQARRMLTRATSIDEVKDIRDRAEALRAYYRQQQESQAMQQQCAEIKIRAERRAGELLAEMALNGGDRRSELHDARVKLADIGIEPTQSHRWQTIAAMPEPQFEAHIAESKDRGTELTSAAVYRKARQHDGGHAAPTSLAASPSMCDATELAPTVRYFTGTLLSMKAQSLELTRRQTDLAAYRATLEGDKCAAYIERLEEIRRDLGQIITLLLEGGAHV